MSYETVVSYRDEFGGKFEDMEGIAALSLENSRGNKKRKLDPQKKVRKLQLITEIFYRNGKVIQNFLAFFLER